MESCHKQKVIMNRKLDDRSGSLLQNGEANPDKYPIINVDLSGRITVQHVKINRTLKFIARNMGQPFNLAKLVEISQMSRRGFLNAFVKHTGTRPGQFLRQIRIEQSKRILIENDLKLTEIAAMSGFGQLNSFCVAFKQATGVAPKQFQRQAWLQCYKSHLHHRQNGSVRKWTTPRSPNLNRPVLSKKIK